MIGHRSVNIDDRSPRHKVINLLAWAHPPHASL